MSRVSELIDLIVQGKNTEATEVLNNELMNRSYEGINELKPEVANNYFASVIDMPNDGQPVEYSEPEAEYEPEPEYTEEPTYETD
tara:strand:- start:217 stop:471 length:255 start_codon:yes stop_codon:yes gene_type:complete